MAVIYKRFLAEAIIEERNGEAFVFVGNDRDVLKRMCDEINETFPSHPYKYHYLYEIKLLGIPVGANAILLKYIYQFESESCRAVLIPIILYNKPKIKGMDKIILDLYYHFRESSFFAPLPNSGITTPHMYTAYDYAFRTLKSKKIAPELVEILKSRRDVDVIPFTAIMIARKWAPKELGEIMAAHLMNKNVTRADVGMLEDGDYKPSLEVIVRETAFTAIECLLYYPSEENLKVIMEYTNHPYKELAKYAQESVEKMERKLLEKFPS